MTVRKAGRLVQLGGQRRRALLAVFLLNANRTLAVERLIKEIWGADPPETAEKMVRNNVSRLRSLLEPEAAAAGESEQLLVTHPNAYELRVNPELIDSSLFERLVREGRRLLGSGEAGGSGAAPIPAQAG